MIHALCIRRSLIYDALIDIRSHPKHIVYIIFGSGALCTMYFGPHTILWIILGCFITTEVVFRILLMALILCFFL